VTIRTNDKRTTRRLFDDFDERHLTLIADTLRAGLNLPAPPPQ
jgi:hypothetical protein